MKNLVRGGVVMSLIGMFVMFIYAQTETKTALNIAENSQPQLTSLKAGSVSRTSRTTRG